MDDGLKNEGAVNIVLVIIESSRTSNNDYKLDNIRFNEDIDKHLFAIRVMDEWNRLSSHVVNANATNKFKQLNKFMK